MTYLAILVIIALFAVVLLIIRIKVALEYVRNDEDDNIVIAFYTLNGAFKYKYEIPLLDVGHEKVRFKLVKEVGKKEKNVSEKKKKIGIHEIYDKYINAKGYYAENSELFCNIRNYLHGRLIFAEFDLHIREGTGNACHTGILSGVLWSLAGIITSLISNNYKILKKRVSIQPSFDSKVFTVDFLCIFHVKLVHIIVVLIKIMRNRYRLKHKIKHEIGGGISG